MTRPGDELERDLRRWLDETARPLPPELLAQVVAELPRNSQERPRRFGFRAAAMVSAGAAIAIVIVITVGALLPGLRMPVGGSPTGTTASPAPARPGIPLVWDVALDFGHGPAHANPIADRYGNPAVWSYRFAASGTSDPASHQLMTEYEASIERWSASGFENLMTYPDRGTLLLHPYKAGSDSRAAVADWASPITGRIRIVGRFAQVQACPVPDDGVVAAIDVDGRTSWTERLQPGGSATFDLELDVSNDGVVSFRVDPANDSNCDSTDLSVEIQTD
jgi:hypothetical protein